MPFSTATPSSGISAPLVDAGVGSEDDYKRLGASARGAIVLVETPELTDIAGLFKEYTDARLIEDRANAAGAAGLIYVGSRPRDVLYRHNVWAGLANTKPMLVMERDGGLRALRLLRSGVTLTVDRVTAFCLACASRRCLAVCAALSESFAPEVVSVVCAGVACAALPASSAVEATPVAWVAAVLVVGSKPLACAGNRQAAIALASSVVVQVTRIGCFMRFSPGFCRAS